VVVPDRFEAPAVSSSETRDVADATAAVTASGAQGRANEATWWIASDDAALATLMERALSGNHDLEVAMARVREVRAADRGARAQLLPQLDTAATGGRVRGLGPLTGVPGAAAPVLLPVETGLFTVGFDAAWEADAFGGLRRERQATLAEVAGAVAGVADARLTVASEVTRVYVALRASQQRRRVAEEQWRLQAETTSLVEARAAAGLDSELDVARARSLRDTIAARIPQFRLEEAVRRQQLGVLVAAPPSTLLAVIGDDGALPTLAPTPAGVPSELLQRRPDVQRAEATLVAATARIGVAKADYFPKLRLGGTGGRQATALSALSLGAGNVFALTAAIQAPIFSAGRIGANVRAAEARAAQAVSAYQQAVLIAIVDVEQALAAEVHERERLASLQTAAREASRALALARDLYAQGVEDFLTVLDAQRSAVAARDEVIGAEQAVATATIALWKATGGSPHGQPAH
jgi:NodT family efflux transporter outer membrane factor (OMF) lipoprotein